MDNLEETTTDMKTAFGWVRHIIHPCTVQVGDRTYSMRESHLREARRVLHMLTRNPHARAFLERVIKIYS